MSRMSLNELMRVVPPPAVPKKTGRQGRSEKVEKELRTKLPMDYFEYARRYGSGSFVQEAVDQTWIWNPLSDGYPAFVRKNMKSLQVAGLIGDYRPFPAKGGLIPV